MPDELLARQMPQATEAEQAVIGAMLIDTACIPEVIELLRPEDFYIEENRIIFKTIYSMFTNSARITPLSRRQRRRRMPRSSRRSRFI